MHVCVCVCALVDHPHSAGASLSLLIVWLEKKVVGEGDSGVKKNSGMRLNERVGTVGTRKPSKQWS